MYCRRKPPSRPRLYQDKVGRNVLYCTLDRHLKYDIGMIGLINMIRYLYMFTVGTVLSVAVGSDITVLG